MAFAKYTQQEQKQLSASMIEKAKNELHENPEQVDAHLESFERWVKSLSHIEFPCETKCLLPFLRFGKYNQSEAHKRLDNFCTLRASAELGLPKWFQFPEVNDPLVEEYLKAGTLVELGQTKDGVTILLSQLSKFDNPILISIQSLLEKRDHDKIDLDTMRLLTYMDHDRFLTHPEMQIGGYGVFFDMEGITNKNYIVQMGRTDMKNEHKVWQDGLPLHPKHLIFANEPTFADVIFSVAAMWVDKDIQDRWHRVNNNLQKAYDAIPGLKEIMPAEYGGGNLPMSELIARHAAKFREYYSKPSPWSRIKVDESKRPDSAKNLMREYKEIKGNMLDPIE